MQQHPPVLGEDPTNLIVNYVPTPVTDAELRQLFEQYGELESARVIVDKQTHHPKGYGFVKFKHESSAREAIEKMNGFEILNKRLKVTPAKGPQNAQINKATQRMNSLHSQQIPQQQQQSVPPAAHLQPHPQTQQMYQPTAAPMGTMLGASHGTTFVIVDANGVPLQTFPPQGQTYPAGAPTFVPHTALAQYQPHPQQQQQPQPSSQPQPQPLPAQQQQPPQQVVGAGGGLPTFQPFRPFSPSKDPIYAESFNLTVTTSQLGSPSVSHDAKGQTVQQLHHPQPQPQPHLHRST